MKPITFLSIALSILSCKKDSITPDASDECATIVYESRYDDTISSNKYLMLHPGSWWKFDNSNIISCSGYDYVSYTTKEYVNSCPVLTHTYHWLPKFNGQYFIDNNCLINKGSYNEKVPFFSEETGVIGSYSGNGGGTDMYSSYSQEVTIKSSGQLDTMLINGTIYIDLYTITRVTHRTYSHTGNGPVFEDKFTFAKNIGLVKYGHYENGYGVSFGITNYYIAPH